MLGVLPAMGHSVSRVGLFPGAALPCLWQPDPQGERRAWGEKAAQADGLRFAGPLSQRHSAAYRNREQRGDSIVDGA